MRHKTALGFKVCLAFLISSNKTSASDNFPCDARDETSMLLISINHFTGMRWSRTTCNVKDNMLCPLQGHSERETVERQHIYLHIPVLLSQIHRKLHMHE